MKKRRLKKAVQKVLAALSQDDRPRPRARLTRGEQQALDREADKGKSATKSKGGAA
jgi:hypothetical protein